MGILHPEGTSLNLARVLDETEAVEGLARCLTQGIDKVTTKDGRLDTRELAAFVLREMARNQK